MVNRVIDQIYKIINPVREVLNLPPDDKVQGIILNLSNHPSFLKIKEKFQVNKRFCFQHVSEATARKVVKNFPSDKVSASEKCLLKF